MEIEMYKWGENYVLLNDTSTSFLFSIASMEEFVSKKKVIISVLDGTEIEVVIE